MAEGALIVAFSGGKDSTAMALRLHELGEPFSLLFTATGNELPEVREHIARIVVRTGAPLIDLETHSLETWIKEFGALPNHRQRWCTRLIKIQPCIAYLKAHPGSVLAVGLRADEEERTGLYGDFATYRYPLREWGWGMAEVVSYVKGVGVPKRTDCALCYGQRIGEWFKLWQEHPAEFAKGEALEAETGHTFRSATRDTWPARLVQLRRSFEEGRAPRRSRFDAPATGELFEEGACRVCRF